MIKKEAQNIFKHKGLTTEIQRMWNVKTEVISLTVGSTRAITKPFRSYLNNTPEKHVVKELQKTATMDTAHILRKVIM